jgi:uncharacterized membrane protein
MTEERIDQAYQNRADALRESFEAGDLTREEYERRQAELDLRYVELMGMLWSQQEGAE